MEHYWKPHGTLLVASAFRLGAKRFGGPPQPWRRLVRRKDSLK